MAYNPTTWQENDLLSADRMNKIEQGIAEASETPDGLLPAGGTAGQMLTKASDNDFDAEWTNVPKDNSLGYSDNFFETYGINAVDDEKRVTFESSDFYTTIKIDKNTSMEDTAEKLNGVISNYGCIASYDKNTGYIIVNKNGANIDFIVTSDDVTLTPNPVPNTIVNKFNGRSGAVTPQAGDYTAEMVGAIANTNVSEITVLTEAEYDALTTKDATTLYLVKEEA